MALVMTPIYTQTVGSGGTSTVTFNNIPQFYTDLSVTISSRTDFASHNALTGAIRFNGDSATNYSYTLLFGNGANSFSSRASSATFAEGIVSTAATATSNVFASTALYLPNYTNTNFKSFSVEATPETNAASFTLSGLMMTAGLWRNTAAVSSITLFPGGGANFTQHSTFSLYGIIRSGA